MDFTRNRRGSYAGRSDAPFEAPIVLTGQGVTA